MKIKYNGAWPNLCSGTLKVELEDGKSFEAGYILCSGGDCGFNDDYSESFVNNAPWSIEEEKLADWVPKDRLEELVEFINEEVPFGCCGGCL